MEKLIELLNEYRTEKGERNLNEYEVSQTLDSLNYLRLFIKWLVDNDKIDLDKINILAEVIDLGKVEEYKLDLHSGIDSVIMLLAIQDKPIEYLLNILK